MPYTNTHTLVQDSQFVITEEDFGHFPDIPSFETLDPEAPNGVRLLKSVGWTYHFNDQLGNPFLGAEDRVFIIAIVSCAGEVI